MKNSIRALFGTLLAATLVSCGDKDKDTEEPITQPVAKVAPAPAPPIDPTAMFRTPDDDMLPTEAQLNQGKESSIGTGSLPINNPNNQPNVSVKPPAPVAPPKPDDQLDPGE